LINLFYPELSGLVQPLSGEYAGRRQVLERLPFFTGYAVETGLLIDLLETYGLWSIAQVDLEGRRFSGAWTEAGKSGSWKSSTRE
jgi:glucosyl-3-phosphoglycerate synthase